MVGPSTTSAGRHTARRRLKVGFVCLVAASGGLVALAGGAALPLVAGATVGAGFAGLALLAYLVRIGPEGGA
jgi:hypothetical protein